MKFETISASLTRMQHIWRKHNITFHYLPIFQAAFRLGRVAGEVPQPVLKHLTVLSNLRWLCRFYFKATVKPEVVSRHCLTEPSKFGYASSGNVTLYERFAE